MEEQPELQVGPEREVRIGIEVPAEGDADDEEVLADLHLRDRLQHERLETAEELFVERQALQARAREVLHLEIQLCFALVAEQRVFAARAPDGAVQALHQRPVEELVLFALTAPVKQPKWSRAQRAFVPSRARRTRLVAPLAAQDRQAVAEVPRLAETRIGALAVVHIGFALVAVGGIRTVYASSDTGFGRKE